MNNPIPQNATPEQRAANHRLGLGLGLVVLAMVIGFIVLFSRHGLPKDPDVWRTMNASAGSSTTASGTTP